MGPRRFTNSEDEHLPPGWQTIAYDAESGRKTYEHANGHQYVGRGPPPRDQPLTEELENRLFATGAAWNPKPRQPVTRHPQDRSHVTDRIPARHVPSRHLTAPPPRPPRSTTFDDILGRIPEQHLDRSQTASRRKEDNGLSNAGEDVKTWGKRLTEKAKNKLKKGPRPFE
ncbi:uncharacterized protein BDZ99DRAFT_546608 [Mytilinidion resinicola]|uniref:Uncharacterized protein n=1 Tax=Mytilinidion resinicola TaxID=574789 RepID=A0A6A6Y489_9PEZI|nr:uncharacterized protein BDZ99DRAFT_546608 [Mytilinidion resinicola]KAF2803470.1 hypothetical protein BDZ99DRAFT_546608 [Mytilinidion resinicola]